MKILLTAILVLLITRKDEVKISVVNETVKAHEWRWELCPFKGVSNYIEFLERVECEEGSDGFYIDILHIDFPEKDYEQLEELLFTDLKYLQ